MRGFSFCIAILTCLSSVLVERCSLAQVDSTDANPTVNINGLIIDRQKYSFTLQTLDQDYNVVIPNGTQPLMRLTRPQINFVTGKLTMDLFMSSPDGKEANNEKINVPLPNSLYLSQSFASEDDLIKFVEQPDKTFDQFVLSARPRGNSPTVISGQLTAGREPGQYVVDQAGQVHLAKLGARKGLFDGFSIVDLRPMETSAWVVGQRQGDSIVASQIRFEYQGTYRQRFNNNLPNVLSMGEIDSYTYHRSLVEALGGQANVHHPPAWLGASKRWNRLHHHVGDLDGQPFWDVIVFNYGFRDINESKAVFQQNVRDTIELLKRTKAKLVWVNSIPVPNGFKNPSSEELVGMVPGRMQLTNQWAGEVFQNYPEVTVCDLWELVDQDPLYEGWRQGRVNAFDYRKSVPLGRSLATTILQALGTGRTINPESVHEVEEPVNNGTQ